MYYSTVNIQVYYDPINVKVSIPFIVLMLIYTVLVRIAEIFEIAFRHY